MLKRIALGVLILLVLGAAGFVGWASATNPIMPEAKAALQDGGGVTVTPGSNGGWLVFQPTGQTPDTGLVFYPGGKVDYRAYAPFARDLARQGFLVIIPKMPLNLAVLDASEAENVIEAYPQIQHWAVGGHSLGGSMAANFARQHPDQAQGLVLLASYPASSDSLADANIRVVSISGSKDGLATPEKIAASRPLLPKDTRFIEIAGGNHGQFGDYGAQSGDGAAAISRADQQQQAVTATVELLKSLSAAN